MRKTTVICDRCQKEVSEETAFNWLEITDGPAIALESIGAQLLPQGLFCSVSCASEHLRACLEWNTRQKPPKIIPVDLRTPPWSIGQYISTEQLVNELRRREGVQAFVVAPYDTAKLTLLEAVTTSPEGALMSKPVQEETLAGPCTLLVVHD